MAEPITNVLGIVGIKNRGVYSDESVYEKLNVVRYNGDTYCAKTTTQGHSPSDTNYWDLMVEKGEKGDKPVKGVDYFTSEDIASMESDVLNEVDLAANNIAKTEELRKKYSNNYHLVEYPEDMGSFFDKLKIYESYDKKNYTCYIDEESLKNNGGNTYYVDKNSTDSTQDGTEAHPWHTIRAAVATSHMNSGDTIIVKKGIYYIGDLPDGTTSLAGRSVNIIAEKGTIIVAGVAQTWTVHETYENVYTTSRNNPSDVIDIRKKDDEVFSRLIQKTSIEEVANNIGTYYINGSDVYVNIGEEVTNDKIALVAYLSYIPFNFYANTASTKYYIENLIFLNGISTGSTTRMLYQIRGKQEYTCNFTAKNCKFLFGGGSPLARTIDANAIYINCEASYNANGDGFSASSEANVPSNVIEINCIGSYNGLLNSSNASNGSTSHYGAHVVRVNGTYFNNKGGNVADVHVGTITLNYGCKAWDSLSDEQNYRSIDFGLQTTGAKMYLYSCYAYSNSKYSIMSYEGTDVVNVYHCTYKNTGGNATINIIE